MTLRAFVFAAILTTDISHSYLAGTTTGDYTHAVQYCQSIGTTIASIHSPAQFQQAQQLCQQTVSANGGRSGCYIGLVFDNDTKIWSWEDGSPIDFGFYSNNNATTGILPWVNNEPSSTISGREPCVHIWKLNGYYYNDATCEGTGEFPLCNDIPMTYIGGTTTGNYNHASAYCQSLGKPIASIHSWGDFVNAQTECQRIVGSTGGCWIGLLLDVDTKSWSWEDESSLDYGFDTNGDAMRGVLPWNGNEPNNVDNGREPCVHIRKPVGYEYNDMPCTATNHVPLCIDNSTASPTTSPTSDPTPDPTRYPTPDPTIDPTAGPTPSPTTDPTPDPTLDPTSDPTADPTKDPTSDPTIDPTAGLNCNSCAILVFLTLCQLYHQIKDDCQIVKGLDHTHHCIISLKGQVVSS